MNKFEKVIQSNFNEQYDKFSNARKKVEIRSIVKEMKETKSTNEKIEDFVNNSFEEIEKEETEVENTPVKKEKKKGGKAKWVVAFLVLLIAAVYGAGVYYFGNHFKIGTKILDTNVAFNDVKTADSKIASKVDDLILDVKLPKGNLTINYVKAGLIVKTKDIENKVLADQNKWLWFVPQTTKVDNTFGKSLNSTDIDLNYGKDIEKNIPKQDFRKLLKYSQSAKEYQINTSKVKKAYIHSDIILSIKNAIMNNKTSLSVKPTKNIGKSLSSVVDKLNVMVSKDIPLKFGGKNDTLDKQYISALIHITKNGIVIDNDKLNSTMQIIAKSHQRIENGNLYTYDVKKLILQVKNDMEHYKVGNYKADETVIKTHKNNGSGTIEMKGSYIEANISAQKVYAWMDGKLVKTFDVVTGDHSKGRDTTLGVWEIWNKEMNKVLKGSTVGSGADYNYAIPVKYWMPIDDTGIGLHSIDPDEVSGSHGRVYWGKDAYLTGRGSHGCVNMHTPDAGWIYNNYPIGTKVYVTP